jgi:hypothetical protein
VEESPRISLQHYQREIHALIDSSTSLDDEMVKRLKKLIESMRDSVLARTAEVVAKTRTNGGFEPEWGPYWMSRLLAEYNKSIVQISQQFRQDLTQYVIKSYEIGIDLADKGVDFVAPDLSKKLPPVSFEQMKIASSYPGDMITGMEEKQLEILSKGLSVSMARNQTPGNFMRWLAQNIDKGPWLSSYARAEVIARTETARVQELARQQRQVQHVRASPALVGELYQQYIVEPRDKFPCRLCAQYDGNVYDVHGKLYIQGKGGCSDPDAPQLPIHPNCRCCLVPWVEGVSPHPNDGVKPNPLPEPSKFEARMVWSPTSQQWIIQLPEGKGYRSLALPKNAESDDLEREGMVLVKAAGFSLATFLRIQRPSEIYKSAPQAKRTIVRGPKKREKRPGE